MTIYAGNFKDEISFARGNVTASASGSSGAGPSFLHVTPGMVGPRIIQRLAFVTKQQRSETWQGGEPANEYSASRLDDASSGESECPLESRRCVQRR